MSYTKPMVTIELQEYQDLLAIKELQSKTGLEELHVTANSQAGQLILDRKSSRVGGPVQVAHLCMPAFGDPDVRLETLKKFKFFIQRSNADTGETGETT